MMSQEIKPGSDLRSILIRPWIWDNQTLAARYMSAAIDGLDPTIESKEVDFFDQIEHSSKYYALCAILLPAYGELASLSVRHDNRIAAVRLAMRVDSYRTTNGQLPASPAEILDTTLTAIPVDPASNKPLVYRKLLGREGYIIYPLGSNGIDNGGLDDRERDRIQQRADTGEDVGEWTELLRQLSTFHGDEEELSARTKVEYKTRQGGTPFAPSDIDD
jgi:hypothetical protein